jgi:hypothetical protein
MLLCMSFSLGGSETNIISGFCKCCHHIQNYEALVKRPETNQPVCGHCFQTGNCYSCLY